jgi:hypothetical protein
MYAHPGSDNTWHQSSFRQQKNTRKRERKNEKKDIKYPLIDRRKT